MQDDIECGGIGIHGSIIARSDAADIDGAIQLVKCGAETIELFNVAKVDGGVMEGTTNRMLSVVIRRLNSSTPRAGIPEISIAI